MRLLSLIAVSTLLGGACFGEDAQLRARAFQMVERAQEVSVPKVASAPIINETSLTFRALGADGAMHEGSYSRVFAGPTGTRLEYTSSDFHLVTIELPDRVAFLGPSSVLPPEFREMLKLLPIPLWHLDGEDVIREIKKTNHKGVAAQCVEFDTIRGANTFNNEFCFDESTGAEIYVRSGNMEFESSAFFDFAGAKLPGHIVQSRNGTEIMDVRITRRVLTGELSPDMFTSPPAADVRMLCKTFRRAFGASMPQPAAGNGASVTEILVHAVIGPDGKVQDAVVENSERPDLNEEALKTARGWTFTPATCNGQPNTQESNLVIRFQGR